MINLLNIHSLTECFYWVCTRIFKQIADPKVVNEQITDSVTQANTKVLGDAPPVATGNLFQATSQALSNAAHNATNAQEQQNVTAQASGTQGD